MLETIFGELRIGRVSRLRFVVAHLVLTVGGMAIMLALLWFSGAAADAAALEAGPEEFDAVLDNLGGGWLLALAATGLLLFFGQINLWAKRLRDMGLPGWWTVLILIGAGVVVSGFVPGQVSSGLNLAVLLALLLVPGGAFGNDPSPGRGAGIE
jgi:uncharacterized membrane protein YhaH (DUF805 family)